MNQIGFDGLWKSDKGHSIVLESKTTDTYRLDLSVLAGYRRALIRDGDISEESFSILIVVGREGTGELEAQIRGSRFAWDIRLISVDALVRLLSIRETLDEPASLQKIGEVLIPREFTKVDGIIDLVFSTATDVRESLEEEDGKEVADSPSPPMDFHEECIEKIWTYLKKPLVKRSRTVYVSPDESLAVVCSVSKAYSRNAIEDYWFAFHPHQREVLAAHKEGYLGLGCGNANQTLLIPISEIVSWLEGMNVTRKDDRMYWHLSVTRESNQFVLRRRAGFERIDLTRFCLS
jgi:hypothetical protein